MNYAAYDYKQQAYRRYRRIILLIILAIVLAVAGFGIYLYAGLPDLAHLENKESDQASVIISGDGVELGSLYRSENRQDVGLDKAPVHLQDALLATEDVRFYDHSGVDLLGVLNVAGSLIKRVFGVGKIRGGSTLTQQLARNLYDEQVGNQRNIERKAREAFAAIYLERRFTKREILNFYLNTVSFGGTMYGVQAAARHYFDKEPENLDVQESALLIGMLKGTTLYNPYRNPGRAKNRRNTVLSQMVKYYNDHDMPWPWPVHVDSCKAAPLSVRKREEGRMAHNAGLATYFREHVRQASEELIDREQIRVIRNGESVRPDLYTDGLRIFTTLDTRYQRHAEAAMREHLKEHQKIFDRHIKGREPWKREPAILTRLLSRTERFAHMRRHWRDSLGVSRLDREQEQRLLAAAKRQFKTIKREMRVFAWNEKGYADTTFTPWDSLKYYARFLEPAVLSIDPSNGHVKAWVGGIDQQYFQYDHVAKSRRQVGSTFKPLVYATVYDNGVSPCTKVPNEKKTYRLENSADWTPQNYDHKYGGEVTLRQGLRRSLNVVAAQLILEKTTPCAVAQLAVRMGIQFDHFDLEELIGSDERSRFICDSLNQFPSMALGAFDLSIRDITSAYAAIANRGVWHEPVFITRIEDRNGNVLYTAKANERPAMDQKTAYVMTQELRGVVTSGTAAGLHPRFKVPWDVFVAGKTGTTQNYSDAWFMGFTPEVAAGVWVGCRERNVRFQWGVHGQGGRMAMPIFARYVQKLYADSTIGLDPTKTYVPPPSLKVTTNCDKYEEEHGGSGPRITRDEDDSDDLFYE